MAGSWSPAQNPVLRVASPSWPPRTEGPDVVNTRGGLQCRLGSLKRSEGMDGARREAGVSGWLGGEAVSPRPESWACCEGGAGNVPDHCLPPSISCCFLPGRILRMVGMQLVGPEQVKEGKGRRGQCGDTCPVLPNSGHTLPQGGRGCSQASAE